MVRILLCCRKTFQTYFMRAWQDQRHGKELTIKTIHVERQQRSLSRFTDLT